MAANLRRLQVLVIAPILQNLDLKIFQIVIYLIRSIDEIELVFPVINAFFKGSAVALLFLEPFITVILCFQVWLPIGIKQIDLVLAKSRRFQKLFIILQVSILRSKAD